MNKKNFKVIFILILVFSAFSQIRAQNDSDVDETNETVSAARKRPQLLRELSLTQAQKRQVRLINQERKTAVSAAQARLRDARLHLDEAIYADKADDNLIRSRIIELQTAQSKLIETRINYELKVRMLLTGEQIGKFRQLRRQYSPRASGKADRVPRRALRNRVKNF